MRIVLLACFTCMLTFFVQAQITQIVAEPIADHDTTGIAELEGMTTYRIYAELTHADDEISAIFGDSESPLSVTSTSAFYNQSLGSDLGWEINPALLPFFPLIQYDSWFTIGASNAEESSNMGNTIGMEAAFDDFNSGGDFIVDNPIGGSIFTLAGDPAASAGDDLRVLIGQLTTAGVIESSLNIQMFINGLQSQNSVIQGISIIFPAGCDDLTACNYEPSGNDSSSCIYPSECEDCNGICADDNDNDICDCDEQADLLGCTQTGADNYDPLATTDDGSCILCGCTYSSAANFNAQATYDTGDCIFAGCTIPDALNYDTSASVDDGTCLMLGCMDPVGLDFDPSANVPGACEYPAPCIADIDGDGAVDVFDLLIFFESYGNPCE